MTALSPSQGPHLVPWAYSPLFLEKTECVIYNYNLCACGIVQYNTWVNDKTQASL